MLEYGINFNTKDGAAKAQKELEDLHKRWQKLFDDAPLAVNFSKIDFNKLANSGSMNKIAKDAQSVGEQLRKMRAEFRGLTVDEARAGAGSNIIERYRKLKTEAGIYAGTLDQAVKAQDRLAAESDKATGAIQRQNREFKKQSEVLTQLKSYAMNFLSVYGGIRLTKNLVDITGEFEMQRVSLQAILQDAEKGAAIFERIKELAIVSPFQFKDLVSYTKQLSAFSVPYEELYDTTKMLADVSAGLGVEMYRIILAYGQVRSAAVLRGQELRQFTEAGIPLVQMLADKFTLLKGEVVTTGEVFDLISTRQVPFEMIKDIFTEMTSEGGKFYKMQEKQAETLAGKIANLKDKFQIMNAEIGTKGDKILKGAIDATSSLMANYEEVGRVLLALAATYGTYRIALVATSAAEGIRTGTLMAQIKALRAVAAAQGVLNAVMAANPYVLVATAVVGLSSALWALRDRTTEMEKGQKAYNDRLEEANRLREEENTKITQLVNTVRDETSTRRERQDAINKLQLMYPDIFANLDTEKVKNLSLADALGKVNEKLERKTDLQNAERVSQIDDELKKLREERDSGKIKYGYAGMYKYEIDYNREILKLETERASIVDGLKAAKEASAQAAKTELADWQKTVDNFSKVNNAAFLDMTNDDNTAYDYIKRIRGVYSDLADKYKEYSKLNDAGSKKQAERLKEQIALAEKLASQMGFSIKNAPKEKTPTSKNNDLLKAAEKLNELRSKMALEEQKYALEIEQVKVNAMEDGVAKERAQIELTKKMELQAIEERKQAMIKSNIDIAKAKWESEGKKPEDFKEEVSLTESQISVLESLRSAADINEIRAKEKMLEEILVKYQDYSQKVVAIEKRTQNEIKRLNDSRTDENSELIDRAIEEVKRKAKEEIATLSFDEMKNSDAWRILFSDLENQTVKSLKEALAIVEKADISSLNAADAKAVQQGIDKMKRKIDEKNPFYALTNGWKDFIKATEENQPDAAMEAINRMIGGAQELLSYYEEFQKLMGATFGEESDASFWTNTAGDIMSANVSTGGGIAKILMGDLSGIKDVIKGVTGYINVFRNIRNRKYDKEIERQEKVVKSLEQEYKRLGKAMEDSLGSDYYKNATKQAENLKAQVAALNKQIEAEKKKGKDSDKNKIAELEAQKQDLAEESSEVVRNAIEKLTGTDLTSAAESFAQAWMDAYVSFGNTTEAMQERFADMMKNMIVNSMLSTIMQKRLKPVFDMIDNAWKDGAMTPEEVKAIWEQGKKATDAANQEATMTMDILKNLGVDIATKESNLTGLSKGISTMSEDTALIMGGYLDSIRLKLFQYIDMMMADGLPFVSKMLLAQSQMVGYLASIEANTKSTADSNKALYNLLDRLSVSTSTGKGIALNTVIE